MVTDPSPSDSTIMPAPRKKLDSEFNEEENKLEMADTQAEIILSQGLPRHIFNNLNQTSTAKEIWENVEMLMQGSGRTIQQRKEDLFDEYERFRAIGNESIHDYFVRFHKLVNDMKEFYYSAQHSNSSDEHQIYTHLKAYEPHAKKTLKKQEQSTSIVDPAGLFPNDAIDGHYDSIVISEVVSKAVSTTNNQLGLLPLQNSCYAKEKGDVLDAEAEAFLADVECTAPYDQPQALTTTNMFQANHEDAYDSDVDEGPNAAVAFMANLSSTSATNSQVNEILSEKKDLADSYLDEIVCLKNANKVARDILQRFNMPTETIPMLFKKPKMATVDLHRTPTRNVPLDEQADWLHDSMNVLVNLVPRQSVPLPLSRNCIINERTTQKPLYVSEWCFDYAKQFVEQQLVPFYDHFKKHIQAANDTFFKEIREFEQIFDELEAEYEQCVLDNKNLTIEKKNLLIKNDCLIAECLEKDICSIVLTSDIVVPPSSNCLCEDLRSACDREHTKVLELEAEVLKQQKMVIESEKRNSHLQKTHIDLQLKFQNYKQCIDTSSASNAIFEINKLRKQLQGKDDTIRNLDAQINIMKVLNVGSTEGSCDQQALETDRIQLKDTITSLRIQLDGLKVENVSLKRRYDELSKANTHSRTAYTEKLSALTAENTKLKAQVTGKTSSGPSTSEKPKVLASGMYTNSSKYIPPPKRANWVKPTPLPKKKQVTFQEPHRTSTRPTQKPPVQQNKKPNVSVNLPTRTKPATEPRKPMPKSDTRNHRIWPSKSENARRAAIHNRNLNFDHNQFVIRSLKSVNTKTPQAKHNGNHTKKVWKATRKHNVNTTKTAWRPKKVVGSVKPQWRPTGRHFGLFDTCPLTRIVEPIVEPLELTPSVSSSSKVTMISRFTDCKLSDRKAGSKGISGIFEC
ncbi:hypothetical protein Tco_0485606 [Tanacetum coccineum]